MNDVYMYMYIVCDIHYMIDIVYCILYSVYYNNIHYTVYTIQSIVYRISIHYVVHAIQYTVYTLYNINTIQCILYTYSVYIN